MNANQRVGAVEQPPVQGHAGGNARQLTLADMGAEVTRIRGELKRVERRDFSLWVLGIFVLWVLVVGVVAPLTPQLPFLAPIPQTADWAPLELLAAFVAATLVFNAHTMWQRRRLSSTRNELIAELGRAQAAEQLSILDPLTQAYSRSYLQEILTKELRRTDRLRSVVSFVVLDVDNFEAINRELGRDAGNSILRELSQLLQKTLRGSDLVGRYGGDEFLIVLPDTDAQNAAHALARVRAELTRWNAVRGLDVRISSGIASYVAGDKLAEVLWRADQNLRAAKRRDASSR